MASFKIINHEMFQKYMDPNGKASSDVVHMCFSNHFQEMQKATHKKQR